MGTEDAFRSMLGRLAHTPCPQVLVRTLSPPGGTEGWLSAKGISQDEVSSASFGLLLVSSIVSLVLMPFASLASVLLIVPLALAPFVVSSLFANMPASLLATEERAILTGSPEAVAELSISMQLSPSLETAVVDLANSRDGVIADRMRSAFWEAITKRESSLQDSMLSFASHLSSMNDGLRQAIHLIVSATDERSAEGMDRTLDRANEVVLSGIREGVEEFASSLQMPVMLLFSMGILLPIMIFSVLPLSLLGGTSLGPDAISALLLVVFPLMALHISFRIVSKSPLKYVHQDRLDLSTVLLTAFIAAFAFLLTGKIEEGLRTVVVLGPPLVVAYITTFEKKAEARDAKDAIRALFALGNRLQSGTDRLECLRKAERDGLGEAARRAVARHVISRDGLERSLREEMQHYPKAVVEAFSTVLTCASKDPLGGGRAAINLARYLSDMEDMRRRIGMRMKGVVDMMTSTVTFFAPMIMGITLSLLAPLQDVQHSTEGLMLTTATFLVEMCLVVTYFTLSLEGRSGAKGMMNQASLRAMTAVAVFVISVMISKGLSAGLL
jgi:hypothetical protein